MLKTLFLNFLSISLVTGLLALGLMLLRKHTKIASKWLCICWIMLSLRLLIPFNLPISLMNTDSRVYQSVMSEISAAADGTGAIADGTAAVSAETAAKSGIDLAKAAVIMWACIAVLFVLWQLVLYSTQRKKLLRWSRLADEETTKAALRIAEEIGLRRKFRVYLCETETPPLLMGILRPVLIIPAGIKDEQLSIALRHELTHLKRNDILFKTLVTAAMCAHWFNPIVHLMAKCAERDAESACDEAVLAGADKGERRVYCDTILDMMRGRRIPFATALTYKKEDIMKRFKNILDTSKRKSGIVLTAVLLCLSVVLCGLAGCSEKKETAQPEQDTAVSETEIPPNGETSSEQGEDWDAILAEKFDEEDEKDKASEDDGYMDIQRAMDLINEYRVQNGLNELIMGDVKLNELALTRLDEAKEKFSHTRPDGRDWMSSFEDEGIGYTYVCENLARGQETAVAVVDDWMNSESHRANLLNPNMKYMHIACGMGETGTELEDYVYWVFEAYAP